MWEIVFLNLTRLLRGGQEVELSLLLAEGEDAEGVTLAAGPEAGIEKEGSIKMWEIKCRGDDFAV